MSTVTVSVDSVDRGLYDINKWMESVLAKNLDDVVPSAIGSATQSATAVYQAALGNGNPNESRLMVLEHEIRTGDYLGEDRFPTLSEIVSVKIKYVVDGDDDERYQFWILKIPQKSQDERALVRVNDLDKREISFYTEILPTIKMWIESQYLDEKLEFKIPYCLYGKYNCELGEFPVEEAIDNLLDCEYLLALEDLRPKEFGKRHFSVGMSIPEVLAVIGEIGKIHATTWAMQEIQKDTFHWETLYHWRNAANMYYIKIEDGLVVLDDFLTNYDDPDALEIASRIRTKYTKKHLHNTLLSLLCPASKNSPNCLIHMDLWSENLLFRIKDEDRECKNIDEADVDVFIIDWQVVTIGRPTHDLAILILTSMSPGYRREHTASFLQYYYEVFKKTAQLFQLELPFGFDVIENEYRDSRLLAALLAIGSIQIVMLEKSTRIRLFEVLRELLDEDIL